MRAVVAIIVAVMSVATGGPLRCPCQFAALFRTATCVPESASAARTAPTPQPAAQHSGCGCKSHTAADEQPPEERQPAQPEPCKHGPGIDLVPPTTLDRQSGDLGAEGIPSAAVSDGFLLCLALVRHDFTTRPAGSDASLPTRLRFSCAFRC